MRKRPYTEGTWFAVPLGQLGYAVGVVARAPKRGGIILCYCFGHHYASVPTLAEVEHLTHKEAVLVAQVGDLGLLRGEWPVIGQASSWNRSDWPMPVFIRREPTVLIHGEQIPGRVWRVYYSEDNPNVEVRLEPAVEPVDSNLPKDTFLAHGAAENNLGLHMIERYPFLVEKLPYREGTWFAVPLGQLGYAVGVVARATGKRGVILCYFFGPRRASVPTLAEVEHLTPDEAILAVRVSDLDFILQRYPIIGHASSWDRSKWPMPMFIRPEPYTDRVWRVYYSDDDPNLEVRLEPVEESAARKPPRNVEIRDMVHCHASIALTLKDIFRRIERKEGRR